MLLSWTITRENANTYANKAPADIAVDSIEPVVILPTWGQLLAMGSGHRAGWLLGSKDNRCIAREFGVIKFHHFMFVPNPSFQRSVIFEMDPKGNPALLLCLCSTVCKPEHKIPSHGQQEGNPPHIMATGIFHCIPPIIGVISIIIICVAVSERSPCHGLGLCSSRRGTNTKTDPFSKGWSPTCSPHCVLSGRVRWEMHHVL